MKTPQTPTDISATSNEQQMTHALETYLRDDLISTLVKKFNERSIYSSQAMARILNAYSDELLIRLRDIGTESNRDMQLIRCLGLDISDGLAEEVIEDILYFFPDSSVDGNYLNPLLVSEAIQELRKYEALPTFTSYSKQTDLIEPCKALLHVFFKLREAIRKGEWLNGDDRRNPMPILHKLKRFELSKLIIEHPDRADEIVNLMIERGSTDAKLLTDAITQGARSLTSGVL